MADFITLTSAGDGMKARFAVAHIVRYQPWDGGAEIVTTEPLEDGQLGAFTVTETPEQIDAMLGVTADPARDAIPDMIDALKMAREYMSDWTGGKPCLDAIDAALAKSGASS